VSIPVANLYYLLCYAWNKLDERDTVNVHAEDANELKDLIARVLINGTEHLLKHGLDRGYRTLSERTARPRGRIDFAASIRNGTLARRQLQCEIDELSYDVPHNRILRTTLRQLATAEGLDRELHERLLSLYRNLNTITEILISDRSFTLVQLHSDNRLYGFLLDVCHLVHDSLLVNQESGARKFRDFIRDEEKMRLLFQSFVKNFYRHHVGGQYKVSGRIIDWQDVEGSLEDLSYLPGLHTDVTMESDSRSIIIDTKYTANAFDFPFGAERIKADHLYQLFAYLQNYGRMTGEDDVEGILLYPAAERSFDLRYTIMGHRVRIFALNLDQHWTGIEEELLRLVLNC
jgi:5-methylcytosine-specific restriction enzyme subunit McrC